MDDENTDHSMGHSNIKNDMDLLAGASMTESYSEILNSPTTDTNVGHGIESNTPIVITKRKSIPLSRHQSSQCKFSIVFFFIFEIKWIFKNIIDFFQYS